MNRWFVQREPITKSQRLGPHLSIYQSRVTPMRFSRLAIGSRFTRLGKQFTKVAPSMAEDELRHGHILMWFYEVEPVGEPVLLPAEEVEEWDLEDCCPTIRDLILSGQEKPDDS